MTIVNKIQNVQGIEFSCLVMAVVIGSMFMTMTGCSSAEGRDLAPREEILSTLRSEGFLFNRHVISTVYGENENQVIVTGQFGKKTPDSTHVPDGFKVTQHVRAVVENVNGKWEVVSLPELQRDQFTSRERWKN